MMIKRLVSIALIFCAAVTVVGCNGNNEEGKYPITDTEQVNTVDLSEYKIVRPDEVTSNYSRLFTKFRIKLKNITGCDLPVGDDSEDETECEILLGNTNRSQSALAMQDLKNGYAVKYTDKKIVINATTPATMEEALQKFIGYLQSGSAILELPIDFRALVEEESYDCLRGLTINAIGDSYFYGSTLGKSKVWLSLLADELDIRLNNYGISGSTVSDFEDHNAMVGRYTYMSSYADIIIIEGGRNDYNVGTPLGDINSRDSKTFAGALNVMIDGLKQKYPNAMIVGITAWYVNSDMKCYSDMMLDVFENQGLACFDAADKEKTGVYMDSAEFRKKYCLNENDVSHLNEEGMKLVMPVFRDFLADEYSKFILMG